MSAWRSSALVSPVRTPTTGAVKARPARSAARPIPASGARRFFSTSKASAQRRDVEDPGAPGLSGTGLVTRRSMADRKAVSVLPLPVGAQIRV